MKYYFFPKQSSNDVECKGQRLDVILWKGSQWAVTEYGLELRNGKYAIAASQFFKHKDSRYSSPNDFWFDHIGQKSWCDKDDLEDAIFAMGKLFDAFGKRNNIESPSLYSTAELEELAANAANRAYENEYKKRGL